MSTEVAGTSDQALNDAVDWLLRLESTPPGDTSWQAFDRWHAAAPANAAAWQRVNSLFAAPLDDLAAVDARTPGQLQMASQMLHQPLPRRRALGGGLALLLLGITGASLGNRVTPLTQLLADLHTATGERNSLALPDGSQLTLDARSAVDLRFVNGQRLLQLREGALHLQIKQQDEQPLRIESRDAQLYSQNARLLLRQMSNASLLSVLDGQVRIAPAQGPASWAQSGQIVRIEQQSVSPVAASLWSRGDWLDGRIDARDETLGELIEALRAYHPGWLRISAQAARQRVYGSFVLADLPRTLKALEESLPIRVQHAGNWLVNIDLKNS